MPKLHVVFCMDTEGPCDDPGNSELLKNWSHVDLAMDKLFEVKTRTQYHDSFGNNFKIGWFFLTWAGFNTNPRNRDFGHHKVRDHYRERWGKLMDDYGDEECWHYHHPPHSGIGNEWSADWSSSKEYTNIISRQIIEREWFPVCFRAGGTIMGAELSQWVDRWFPFDYSNRAPLKFTEMDWSDGVISWQPYQPDPIFFKQQGAGKRHMTRCMDLHTGMYVLSEEDIFKAFNEASLSGGSILSVFDHDYRDIESRVTAFLSKIQLVAKTFPNVAWEYSTPSDAIVNCIGKKTKNPLKIHTEFIGKKLNIKVNSKTHQEYPWVVVQDGNGVMRQIVSNIQKTSEHTWEIALDSIKSINIIGVAASNDVGESSISRITINNNT